MKKNFVSKSLLIFVLVFIFLFLFLEDSLASCSDEYRCIGGCGGEVQKKSCHEECTTDEEGEEHCHCECGSWRTYRDCESWQQCNGRLSCYCEGECLEIPKNPRYYDNPTYSDQKDYGNKNIYLPVKLDWDDVEGWGKADGPRSYVIEINNARPKNLFRDVSFQSYYTPPSCTLKSNVSHSWGAQACCSSNGQNCGSKSDWSLETNISPELIFPADPDWTGPTSTENVSIPAKLDWCDVSEAKSYFLKIDKDGKLYYPFPVDNRDGLKSEVTLGPELITKLNTYDWQIATCLNDDWTKCGTKCSDEENGQECGDYSQTWKITTGSITLPVPEIIFPEKNETVNFYSNLVWESVLGIEGVTSYRDTSYRYEIYKQGILVATSSVLSDTISVSFETFWEKLEFNQEYSWAVRSCWDKEGSNCEPEASQSTFKTTGAPPTFEEELSGPKNGAVDILVPANLNWDDMGAASYYYEISPLIPEEERVVKISEALVGYPVLGQGKSYQWQVKACADREGKFCGKAAIQSFTTIRLAVPTNPLPENGGKLSTTQKNVEWGEVLGANFYQYKVDQGKIEGTSQTNYALLLIEKLNLGGHNWQVRACLDKDCKEAGIWSNWSFTLVQREDCRAGFIPCGRDCDVSETSWNERESCGFNHIFLIFKNILDFLLWRLVPIVLVLLVLGTGVIFYFSMGTPGTVINVRKIWKSAGIGFAVIFLAWNFLNFILNLFGFTIKWWKFPF